MQLNVLLAFAPRFLQRLFELNPMIDEFELCKEQYFREFDRKDVLTRSLALPVGIGTVIASGLLYVANSVEKVESRTELAIVFLIFLGGACLLVAIYNLCRAYIGYTYRHVPTLSELREYKEKLKQFHDPAVDADELSNKETYEYLTDKLAYSAHKNSENNDIKSGRIYLATRALVLALACLLTAVVPIVVGKFGLSSASIILIIRGY